MKENAITAQLVKKHVLSNAILIDYLSRDLINVTQLARELLPKIQAENSKATIESISVAIHRLQLPISYYDENLKQVLSSLQLTMRTGVSLLCVSKSTILPPSTSFSNDDLYFVNQGSEEITIILDSKNESFIPGKIIYQKDSLAVLSLKNALRSKKRYRDIPGYVNLFLAQIARAGVNIQDTLSTYGQLTFVVEEKDISLVYQICKDVISKV
jgi:hypothetical protein